MKKFFVTIALAVAIVGGSFAADGVKIDRKIQAAFQKEFAEAFNPRWESVGSGLYHVSFTQNSEVMDAYYNEEGQMVSLSRYVSREQLPILVNKTIDNKLGSAEVGHIRELVSENETSYLVTAKKEKGTVVARIYTTGGFQIVKRIKNVKG
jgi:hypothetical protein